MEWKETVVPEGLLGCGVDLQEGKGATGGVGGKEDGEMIGVSLLEGKEEKGRRWV